MKDTRSILSKPEWGRLRQGVIFSAATADEYRGCEVHGLVITAHCDLVHEKVPVVNFVPIVRISDWLLRDFAHIAIERIRAQRRGDLGALLKDAGFSPSILDTERTRVVIDTLFPEGGKAKDTRPERARKLCSDLELCDELRKDKPLDYEQHGKLRGRDARTYDRLMGEVLRNQLTGYYFLPAVDPAEPQDGFVVLFRQIYHLRPEIALVVANGASGDEIGAMVGGHGSALTCLDTRPEAYAMPVGQLSPPYLEHLMQAFGLLYTRIGVPDVPSGYQESLMKTVTGGGK